jgi:hypothetical protein
MSYLTELTDTLRDSKINEDDRQAILRSLRELAAKGDASARLVLCKEAWRA